VDRSARHRKLAEILKAIENGAQTDAVIGMGD